MENHEMKNLKAQLSLSEDIIRNNDMVIVHINEQAKTIIRSAPTTNYDSTTETYTISKDEWQNILRFMRNISDRESLRNLNNSTNDYIKDSETKLKILNQLK